MKKIITLIILLSLTSSGFSFASNFEIDEDIDLISLDLLHRSGLISLEEKESFLESRYETDLPLDESIDKSKDDEGENLDSLNLNEFIIDKISQVGQSAIKIDFSQRVDDKALNRSYYKIYKDNKLVFKFYDYEIRSVESDKSSVVLRLKDKIFDENSSYELRVSTSLTSTYDMKFNATSYYGYRFSTSNINFENSRVISYETYEEGLIDIKFDYEVTDEFTEDRLFYKLTYNDDKFMKVANRIELLEDKYGVSRIVRLYMEPFEEKYDYKLDLSKFKVDNPIYRFPGGATLSKSFNIYEIDIIDNYTIDVTLGEGISKIGNVRIKNGALIENFEIYDENHVLLYLNKDAGLRHMSSYELEFIDIVAKDNRKYNYISQDFLTEASLSYDNHITLEVSSAKWVGQNYMELEFNKPADINRSVNAYIKVKDESYNTIPIISTYMLSPYKWIIKTKSGSFGDKYELDIKKLPEKGNQFKSDDHSITITN